MVCLYVGAEKGVPPGAPGGVSPRAPPRVSLRAPPTVPHCPQGALSSCSTRGLPGTSVQNQQSIHVLLNNYNYCTMYSTWFFHVFFERLVFPFIYSI